MSTESKKQLEVDFEVEAALAFDDEDANVTIVTLHGDTTSPARPAAGNPSSTGSFDALDRTRQSAELRDGVMVARQSRPIDPAPALCVLRNKRSSVLLRLHPLLHWHFLSEPSLLLVPPRYPSWHVGFWTPL